MPASSARRLIVAVLGSGLVAAGIHGCAGSEPDTPSTTTSRPTIAPTTTSLPASEPTTLRDAPTARHGQGRARRPRAPRMPRMAIRAALAEAIAARRPDRPLSPGELERLTNQAMHIRVMRSRLARLQPDLADTPRVQHLQSRLDTMVAAFQTQSGVSVTELSEILDPKPMPAPAP